MATTPNGPLQDERPIFMGSYMLERTVMPTRAILRCDTEFTAIPELVDGVAIAWQQQFVDIEDDWYTVWKGTTGWADILFGYQTFHASETGRWGATLLSAVIPTFQEWHATTPQGPEVPWPSFNIPAFVPSAADLRVQWLSEWVDIGAMYPDVTLLDIP